MNVISRFVTLCALLVALVACSSDGDEEEIENEVIPEALICPTTGILSDASVMRVFAGGPAANAGDVAYDLEFMRASLLECELNKEHELTAKIRFDARAQFGPALSDNTIRYPYFVAVLDPAGKVLSKTVREGEAKFKSGGTLTRFGMEYDDIKFTVPEGKDGLGYEILIGFQLTREQVEFNRARKAKSDPDPNLVTQ